MCLLVLWGRGEGASEEYLKVCFVGLVVSENYVWCLAIFVIFMGFWIWRIKKEVGDALKSPFAVAMQAASRGRDSFNEEVGFPLCNNAALKLYLSLTGYCKRFYRMNLFSIFLLFPLFCIYYWDWQGQKCKLKYPKILRLTLNYIVTVIAALTLSYDPNTITQKAQKYEKTHNIWMKFFWNKKIFHVNIKEISTLISRPYAILFLIKLSAMR